MQKLAKILEKDRIKAQSNPSQNYYENTKLELYKTLLHSGQQTLKVALLSSSGGIATLLVIVKYQLPVGIKPLSLGVVYFTASFCLGMSSCLFYYLSVLSYRFFMLKTGTAFSIAHFITLLASYLFFFFGSFTAGYTFII